jgi:hypothetical protein
MQFDQPRRREFMTLLGGVVVLWPLASLAQQAKVPIIGALVIGNTDPAQFWRLFRQGLRDLGYVEGAFDLSFDRRKDTLIGFPYSRMAATQCSMGSWQASIGPVPISPAYRSSTPSLSPSVCNY